jgi:PPOX class probable F420-dependent enzyme
VVFEPWQMEMVEELRVGRLGTVARDGRPHLVPVCYAFVNGTFVVAVDEKPKRAGQLARVVNIERDPRATLLLDRYDDDWRQLAWVRVDAGAEVIATGKDWPEALAALRARYAQYAEMALEAAPLIVLTPERVVAWRWRA